MRVRWHQEEEEEEEEADGGWWRLMEAGGGQEVIDNIRLWLQLINTSSLRQSSTFTRLRPLSPTLQTVKYWDLFYFCLSTQKHTCSTSLFQQQSYKTRPTECCWRCSLLCLSFCLFIRVKLLHSAAFVLISFHLDGQGEDQRPVSWWSNNNNNLTCLHRLQIYRSDDWSQDASLSLVFDVSSLWSCCQTSSNISHISPKLASVMSQRSLVLYEY